LLALLNLVSIPFFFSILQPCLCARVYRLHCFRPIRSDAVLVNLATSLNPRVRQKAVRNTLLSLLRRISEDAVF
jgi:hypothetical protein